jgi:hypothetical protein
VKGNNSDIDAAAKWLAGNPEEDAIHAITEGSYTTYAWDESITLPTPGLSL